MQAFRLALRIRKPEREAVVVGDGEAQAFRREGKAADGRGHLDGALRALASAHEGLSARRPRERADGADRHVIDPTLLGIGGNGGAVSLRVDRHHLAVVAAGHDAVGIGGSRKDSAAVGRDAACLARARC